MRILITGGSGFIGSNLIESIKISGCDILNIDIQSPKIKSHKEYWKEVNINDYQTFRKCVIDFNPTHIVHLAARTDLDGNSLEDYKTNTSGVSNLIEITKELHGLKKVIITSSMLVCKVGYNPKDQFDYCPNTIYGNSKVITEKIVWAAKIDYDWVIIRPTSIWGPWFSVPYRTFFDLIISNKYFHIGNKSCVKTYGFVLNSVYQITQLLYTSNMQSEEKVFYIGDYIPIPIEIWANEIAKELNSKIIKLPYFTFRAAARIGDFLKIFNVEFPMTSFRLKNMTTNNIINLSNTKKIAPVLPFSRVEGIKITLDWLNKQQ